MPIYRLPRHTRRHSMSRVRLNRRRNINTDLAGIQRSSKQLPPMIRHGLRQLLHSLISRLNGATQPPAHSNHLDLLPAHAQIQANKPGTSKRLSSSTHIKPIRLPKHLIRHLRFHSAIRAPQMFSIGLTNISHTTQIHIHFPELSIGRRRPILNTRKQMNSPRLYLSGHSGSKRRLLNQQQRLNNTITHQLVMRSYPRRRSSPHNDPRNMPILRLRRVLQRCTHLRRQRPLQHRRPGTQSCQEAALLPSSSNNSTWRTTLTASRPCTTRASNTEGTTFRTSPSCLVNLAGGPRGGQLGESKR